MAAQHVRHLWIRAAHRGIYRINWEIVRHDSFLVITAAEARLGRLMPDRFIGDARPIMVGSIAPQDGFVEFSMFWPQGPGFGSFPYLNIWTDTTVFDPSDPIWVAG